MPTSLLRYIRDTRTRVESLPEYLREKKENVQKITLNFYPVGDGTYWDRDWAIELLSGYPEVSFLTGGYHNLEFTKAGVKKGPGLLFLAGHLGIPLEETMAVGDTENDLDILRTAGLGVAMGNAQESVKQTADFITRTNEESGVAYALRRMVL
ncbi:MAG: HAD hydrolase family protein [Blautia sp.]|nr:HAD hydrolase family protein [Blautia sp.]